MPKAALQATATVTAKTERVVKLTTKQTTKLRTALKSYNALKAQSKTLDHAMKRDRGIVNEVLEEVGEASISLDGSKATIVAPVRKKTDLVELKKVLIAKGVDPDVADYAIQRATKETPQTPYVKITAPGEKEDEE